MRNSKSQQTKSSTRLSTSSTNPSKKSVTTTTTTTKSKPKVAQKSLTNKDLKITTTSKTTTTKNLSSSRVSSIKSTPTSTTKTSQRDTKSSKNLTSSTIKTTNKTTKPTTTKKKLKEKQQGNVTTTTTSLDLAISDEAKDGPICSEINSVMNELEKFRTSLHELGRVQEKQNEIVSSSKNSNHNKKLSSDSLQKLLLADGMSNQDEIVLQAHNQLSVVRQHITSMMDNYESLDENLLTVIMTYNEEVNIALQEALQEVPKLYQSQSQLQPPSPSLSLSSQFTDDSNSTQQFIESQKIQIQFLEQANFNNVFQLTNDIKKYDLYEKNEKYSKVLICQVLQRLLLETVLENSDIYFTGSLQNVQPSSITNDFDEESYGCNNHPLFQQVTKINPEVYAVLGSNCFDGFEHPFIEFVGEKLVEIVEKYFEVKHDSIMGNKLNLVNLSNELVYDIINVFYFRMQAQEPSAQYQWMENGMALDLHLTSIVNYNIYCNNFSLPGDYENCEHKLCEEEFDVVGVCSFPVIGKGLKSQEKLEIYTKAKVLPYSKLNREIK
ncbi:15084_t:CDS:2 [Funneliformis geosporum]|uniref:15784_t:CDS:1 n=1 Tax=Funneliformis geosporum TaxID=1117311 RepID=A0A9W4SY48_9GLOM|nr:15084_t:CDS:2 [Funneliformis geosporum]CAI2185690.1 15784_t:CDS:2 [Funneliformis geosporum]